MDESIGSLVAKLEELDLDDNTIILFTSDNGGMSAANFGNPSRVIAKNQLDAAYATSNLPLRGGKGWLYEGGIRVPMIAHVPKALRRNITQQTDQVCEVPVISSDLYPTILELAGLPARPAQHCDGMSLVPLLEDSASKLDRPALFWHFPHYSNHGMQSPGAAVRAGDWKLIEYFENGTVQLFDLKRMKVSVRSLRFTSRKSRRASIAPSSVAKRRRRSTHAAKVMLGNLVTAALIFSCITCIIAATVA